MLDHLQSAGELLKEDLLGTRAATRTAPAVWAFAHGMVALELAQRFPPGTDLEPAWSAGISALG